MKRSQGDYGINRKGQVMRIVFAAAFVLPAVLLVMGASPPPGQQEQSVLISGSDDAYVVTDAASQQDPNGLRDKNFGGLDFLKIWYAFGVPSQSTDVGQSGTTPSQKVVSLGLVRFDLSQLKDQEIRSATLQMFAVRADLAQPARLVDVSQADGDWSEGAVTFNNVPQVQTPALATTAVYGANTWYSWDVSPAIVRKARDGSVTFAVGMHTLDDKQEEQVVFSSHEAGRNAPRLLVTVPVAAPTVPIYVIPVAVGVALLMFAVGLIFGLRRRAGAQKARKAAANARVEAEPAVADEEEAQEREPALSGGRR